MKRYIILISLFAIFICAIIFTRKKEPVTVTYAAQSESISSSSEWLNTKKAISGLEDDLRKHPSRVEVKLKLAQAYIQQGKVTGDHYYYDALAYKMVNEVLQVDANNFEALCSKATLQASAHQFSDALLTANKAIKINPYNSYIYGVQCDANVELGKYEDAIKSADKMTSLRPDIGSYSRISYLREIIGDYKGAIDAMQRAVNSHPPGFEQTEWSRVYLGHLYEINGNLKEALNIYKIALHNRPAYAPAIAGLGRIAKANNNYDAAIKYYTEAADLMLDYSFHHELGILYKLAGKDDKSEKEFDLAIDMLVKHQHPTSEENGIGHNIDRELSLVYISMKKYDEAYNNAYAEYLNRPDNIDVNESLAWAEYNIENYSSAKIHILKALSTKSKNAELWYKAGLIFKKNNLNELGEKYITIALFVNPYLHVSGLNKNASQYLASQ